MNKTFSNLFYNALYQCLILAIPLITVPYVARVLGVYAVGVNAYVVSVATFLSSIIPMGLFQIGSREIAKTPKKDLSKVFKKLWFNQILAGAIVIILYIIGVLIYNQYVILFLLEIPFLLGYMFDISWFFIGIGSVKRVIGRNTMIKILSIILIFLLVHKTSDLPIYVGINSFSIFIANLVFCFSLRKYLKSTYNKAKFSLSKVYLKESLLLMIPQFGVQFYSNFDNIMVKNLAGDAQLTFYDQSQRIVRMMVAVITSISTVLMPLMVKSEQETGSEAKSLKIFKISLDYTLMISIYIALMLMINASQFVPWFWGKNYDPMVSNLFWVSLILIFISYGGVFANQYTIAKGNYVAYSIPFIIGAVVNLSLNYLFVGKFGSMAGTINLVITEFAVCLSRILVVVKGLNMRKLTKGQYKSILSFIVTLLICLWFPINAFANFFNMVLESILGTIIYFAILYVLHARFVDDFKMIMNNIRNKKVN